MYCIFCYVEYFDIGDNRHEVDQQRKKRQYICERFFKTIQEESGLRLKTYSGSIALESACESCLLFAFDYCKLITQIKVLKIRLNEKTSEFVEIIQKAESNVLKTNEFQENYISPEEIPAIDDFRREFVDRWSAQTVLVEPLIMSGNQALMDLHEQDMAEQSCQVQDITLDQTVSAEFQEEISDVYLSPKVEDYDFGDDGIETFPFPITELNEEEPTPTDFARVAMGSSFNNTKDTEGSDGNTATSNDLNDVLACDNEELSCHKPPPTVSTLKLNCGNGSWNNENNQDYSTSPSKDSVNLPNRQKWTCQLCYRKISTKSNMKRHIIKIHGLAAFKEQENIWNSQQHSKPSWTKGIHYLLTSTVKKKKRPFIYKKQHECPLCKKRCRDKTKLQEHLRSHSGERPYCCGFCMKTFTTKSNVKRHVTSVHPQKLLDETQFSNLQTIISL